MDEQAGNVAFQGTKVVTLWATIGITSWTDVAAFLGALYSAVLIAEWCWKKFKAWRARKHARAAKHGQ